MSLSKKLTTWKEQQFITQEQCDKILAFEQQNSGNTFWHMAFIIAGLLIGLGFCLLVAANWHVLGTAFKLIADFALLGGLFYATWWCMTRQRRGLTELFTILSFLMIGATIGLIGQIFNLEGGWSSFATAWALLGLPFVIVSRSTLFNMIWWCLFFSLFNNGWVQQVVMHLVEHFDFNVVFVVVGLCLASFAGKKLDEKIHPHTVLPNAFAKLMMWLAYVSVWVLGLRWGTLNLAGAVWRMLLADMLVFVFFAGRMFWAIRTQNMTSFRRNAILTEIYIFILFASNLGSLFMSGIGFILGGLAILMMIYIFRRTSKYIKNMEIFK
ncbi:MAG: DUF2157 domain-containing protein [Elusimicrobiaceae bacterium]|nr:DUF2157 domain-containing protein [Elusimicrobiaceae bacterium]